MYPDSMMYFHSTINFLSPCRSHFLFSYFSCQKKGKKASSSSWLIIFFLFLLGGERERERTASMYLKFRQTGKELKTITFPEKKKKKNSMFYNTDGC